MGQMKNLLPDAHYGDRVRSKVTGDVGSIIGLYSEFHQEKGDKVPKFYIDVRLDDEKVYYRAKLDLWEVTEKNTDQEDI